MNRAVSISVPHSLGREAAAERLKSGVDRIRGRLKEFRMELVEEDWQGHSLTFGVMALGYTVKGRLDVEETSVRIEVMLPLMLALFAEKLKAGVQKQGQILLDHKNSLT